MVIAKLEDSEVFLQLSESEGEGNGKGGRQSETAPEGTEEEGIV